MKRCAGGILLQERQILLGKRSPDREFYPDVWDVVGGHCLNEEDPAHALVRELEEEIDVMAVKFEKLSVLPEPQPELYGAHEYHIYIVTEWTGKGPTVLGKEHTELRWFPVEEALLLDYAHPGYGELFERIGKSLTGTDML